LNRYIFVKGKPAQYTDPFGLFSTEDGISIAFDLAPFVGSCKGVAEFVLGKDPITGKPIPRWMAVVGILPFGNKVFTRGKQTGEAVVYLYKGDERHFSILVRNKNGDIHTE